MFLQDYHLGFSRPHAKILSQMQNQKGQFAWSKLPQQPNLGSKPFQIRPSGFFGHQRLHVRNLHFAQWLVGFTDGDGCFCIEKSREKYNLSFSISQSIYNIRILAFIKKHVGVGSISISKNQAVYRVRNAKHLNEVVLPIFEKYQLQTSKYFHGKRVKLGTKVMLDQSLTTQQKRDCLSLLRSLKAPDESEWDLKCTPNLTDDWIAGFFEADGSFFLTCTKVGDACSFGITQKRDRNVLEAIRKRFSIPAKVRWNPYANAYILETKNQTVLLRIDEFARDKNILLGMKSLEHKLWSKALYYQTSTKGTKSTREDLSRKQAQIKAILRKLKTRQFAPS
jgi:hypothetical protein